MKVAMRGGPRVMADCPPVLSREARIKRLVAIAGAAFLVVLAGFMLFAAWKVQSIAQHLPSVANLADTRSHPMTTIVTSDGALLAAFETQHRRPIPLEQISPYLIDATLATEDARFYQHHGVDTRGTIRALVKDLFSRNWTAQGGSTITQQLARNLYLSNRKTIDRKIEEILIARQIELQYSKHDILEAYLNTIYYANGCYGAEAASRAYFHKAARDLTLGEAALLAGIPQRPAAYSPLQHRDSAINRRSEVLKRMVAAHKITLEQIERAEAAPLHIYRPHLFAQSDWKAPYFVAHVLDTLRDEFGPEYIYSGVRIVTTLDWKLQKAAERALRSGLTGGLGPNTGALVALDPRNGAIRALVGGADFRHDQFDAATQGVRQPGSAFKPIVYASAFDSNVCNLASTVEDKKLVYLNSPHDWVVHNYDGRYRGSVSVLEAIRQSINTVAVQIADETGPNAVQNYAQQLGISTPIAADLPVALGASGVHPIELCSAYSAFANQGVRYDPYAISQILDGHGDEVFQDDSTKRLHARFMNQDAIDQINVALREVVLNGTGAAANYVPDAHGKTGTTSSHRDAWFAGYTGSLAAVVWMAHADKRAGRSGAIVTRYSAMPGATGGSVCAPVWARFMAVAMPLQNHVDRSHGIEPGVVEQPRKDALFARLQAESSHTGLEQAQQQDRDDTTSVPAVAVSVDGNPVDAYGESAGFRVVRTGRGDAVAQTGTAATNDSQDVQMRNDMEQGYREFESRSNQEQ